MTREEKQKAIDALKISVPIMGKTHEEFKDYIQTLNKVMDWLEQEPTTKNNLGVDYINRAELLKAMDTWDKFGYTARYGLERLEKDDKVFVPYVKYDDMVKCVKGMPLVTPIRPKGHWINNAPQYDMLNPQYICSECGNAHIRTTPYCEMCGVKMVEPQESGKNE